MRHLAGEKEAVPQNDPVLPSAVYQGLELNILSAGVDLVGSARPQAPSLLFGRPWEQEQE